MTTPSNICVGGVSLDGSPGLYAAEKRSHKTFEASEQNKAMLSRRIAIRDYFVVLNTVL